ncbi:MAG: hypothetical protein H8E68_07360 [Kiritimatiellaeota bacterium]|nr:hypothetical protein [Kiritimatiellota bacterium]
MLFFISTFAMVVIADPADNKQTDEAGPSVVEITKVGPRFELTRNGLPYFIKGAGGSQHMDKLVASGGNSIRTWSASRKTLDQAQQKGLTVCMGLRVLLPRQGADYGDEKMLKKQRDRICDEVMELKDHPALLMWGIGNEVEHHTSPEEAILVWEEIEVIAEMIKEIDKNHPVITVIAGVGEKLADIQQLCPTLDAIGINSYGKLGQVPAEVQRYNWKKPYIITEFGPRGWWEVEKTDWELPIEDTSTEKAQFYYTVYKAAIEEKPNCLGSYVFLWGNKQEKTHTWFNLFMEDGSPTEIVDAMTLLWTGEWPTNRAPTIGKRKIYNKNHKTRHKYPPSSEVIFLVQATDPEGDALTITWDLRRDESDNLSTGGDREKRIKPIKRAIVSSEADHVMIQMPDKPGNYRVFVYVYDPSGKVATANLPIQVK